MKYDDIRHANETIKTTNIKGKEYAEVNQRISAFRMIHPDGKIMTEILSNTEGICLIKATICDKEGNILGTGHAYERENSSFINKTSYIENCETSAVGRALGMCGIGVDNSVASYEEVANAIEQQSGLKEATATDKKVLKERCKQLGISLYNVLRQVGLDDEQIKAGYLTKEQHGKSLIILKEIEESQNEVNNE
ncbi:MAG: hypothetical protein ACLSU9_10885 [Anaerovoracaceae bacterium]